jgi:hypothetical protein
MEPRFGSGFQSKPIYIGGVFKCVTGTIIDCNLNEFLYYVHTLFKGSYFVRWNPPDREHQRVRACER